MWVRKNEKIKTVSLLIDGIDIDGLDRQKFLFLFVFYLLAALGRQFFFFLTLKTLSEGFLLLSEDLGRQ
jgi:hypothetical protein